MGKSKIHAARAELRLAEKNAARARREAGEAWASYDRTAEFRRRTIIEEGSEDPWSRVGDYGRRYPPPRTSKEDVEWAEASATASLQWAARAEEEVKVAAERLAGLYAAHAGAGRRP